MTMKTMNIKLTGIRPLVLHNGFLADRTNPYVPLMNELTAKKKNMTEADCEKLERLHWEASLYWDDEVGPYMPSDNLDKCGLDGAKKIRKGTDYRAAVIIDDVAPAIEYDGPRTMDEMYNDPKGRFVLRKGVRIQKNRVIRVRPMIPTGWKIKFSFTYDETVINKQDIQRAFVEAGALIGLGDWRPKFGRFESEFD